MNAPQPLYLIACPTAKAPTLSDASAQTMGFKAWNLLRMAMLGLPVPPAFVLGTAYCADEAWRDDAAKPGTWLVGMQALEARMGQRFGDTRNPLLLSVRSGAPVSMPGMMETLLNVGLCDATLPGFLRQTGNPRLVWDAYRRLVATFAEVVEGLDSDVFEKAIQSMAAGRDERELDFSELRELTRQHLQVYAQLAGRPFPQEPAEQLSQAISAVLRSWQSDKACAYRAHHQLSDAMGTAVTVQAMVFGNAGGRSGAGVGFTRNPATGEPALWVDFLFNAQGEDVVSGRRSAQGHDEMANVLPVAWAALQDAAHQLERHFGDMQDFEFTVQDGQLFMLQTRQGKRTPQAAARIALDLLDEGVINADEARARTQALGSQDLACLKVVSRDGASLEPLAMAPSACNGVVWGEIALDAARMAARQAASVPLILVRRHAETDDIVALEGAMGLLTQRGARTSHAAVVARQLGKVCLVGCHELQIDEASRTISIGKQQFKEGDVLTLDGNEGCIYAGEVHTVIEEPVDLLARLALLRSPR